MERTGHRSVEGIRTSDKLKELSSNILNHDNKRVKVIGDGAVSKCDVSNQLCDGNNTLYIYKVLYKYKVFCMGRSKDNYGENWT